MAKPARGPILNSIVDNPQHGDERNFVQVRNVRGGTFGESAEACPGEVTELYVYIANDVASHLLEEGTIRGLRLRLLAGEHSTRTSVTAVLSASNTDSVWDSASVSCAGRPVSLRMLEGTAQVVNADDGYNFLGNPFKEEVPLGKSRQDGEFSEGKSTNSDGVGGWSAYLLVQVEVLR